MGMINLLQAKASLSRLVEDLEQGRAKEYIIARNGKPAARLLPLDAAPRGQRIGAAKGRFKLPASIDAHSGELARLFHGGQSKP